MELKNFKFKISTFSPVCISDTQDKVLSPYTDFVIKQGNVHYIDHLEMDSYFAHNPSLVNIYSNKIKALYKGGRSTFSLAGFIENELGSNVEDITRLSLEYKGQNFDRKNNITSVIRNAGKPYIPGSSVKGALKGAFLYYWLNKTANGSEVLGKIYNAVKYINDSRNLVKAISDLINPFLGSVNNSTANEFNNLRATDSSLFHETDLAVYHAKRLHMKKGITQIPADLEAINPGKDCAITISINGKFSGEREWLNQVRPQELSQIVNLFSRQNLEHDWEDLDDHVDDIEDGNLYDNIFDFYENSAAEMDKPGNDAIYLRLGSGKGFLHQTIGLALKNKDNGIYSKYFKHLRLGKGNQKQFPVTRLFAIPQGTPFGWVKIIMKNE
ncbi:MAG: type III-A CRISPR-associated RAMP protein Csm5 [Bacteroidales bacterium]|nr:type III-A CRISPR-associated RAMP protein Csm5 [Bacteroidales bacterium]